MDTVGMFNKGMYTQEEAAKLQKEAEMHSKLLEEAAKPQKLTTNCGKAVKLDSGKPMMSLVPAGAVRAIAEIMTFGAVKYSPNNWRGGFKWSRLLDAAHRHLNSYTDGERLDPESGKSHLAHACCMLMMLIEHEQKGYGTDDLYKGEK